MLSQMLAECVNKMNNLLSLYICCEEALCDRRSYRVTDREEERKGRDAPYVAEQVLRMDSAEAKRKTMEQKIDASSLEPFPI